MHFGTKDDLLSCLLGLENKDFRGFIFGSKGQRLWFCFDWKVMQKGSVLAALKIGCVFAINSRSLWFKGAAKAFYLCRELWEQHEDTLIHVK